MFVIAILAIGVLALAGCGGSDSGTINIVGTWTGMVTETSLNSFSATLIVTSQSGTTWSGTFDGDSVTGAITGSSSSFTYSMADGDYTYTGSGLLSGSTMSGS